MHNVKFGLAFLSDETEASFLWLFKTFLESMGIKQPETIFTNQCQAIMNAVEKTFPDSHHRLRQWHIYQNAPSHFDNLNNNSVFKSLFNICMQHCESMEEFEDIWSKLIVDCNLQDHSWLMNMYKLRHKWSTAFSKHQFSARLKATSRSEYTNATLKDGGKRTHTLFECVQRTEKGQNKWRQDEKEDDFRCRHGIPTLLVKGDTSRSDHESEVVCVNHIMRCYHDLSMRSKACPEARILLEDSGVANMNVMDNTDNIHEERVRNPLYVKSRGVRNAHLPNHWNPKSK
ncbi:hypothetical protein BUALT_Bualt08G0009200 [Buddleja alternifolia]|uniref:MULE transposase domain-containing protein n=1 Tax=Buddleja alternifolia TaxID=168488 RepID=A0AAV6X6W4_9LAMI|nr:hypothetical protein BUALT_Bualt08G0009200 [Buddleja alternifolia]